MLQLLRMGLTFVFSQQCGQTLGMFSTDYSVHIAIRRGMSFVHGHISISSLSKMISTLFHEYYSKISTEYHALLCHLFDRITAVTGCDIVNLILNKGI